MTPPWPTLPQALSVVASASRTVAVTGDRSARGEVERRMAMIGSLVGAMVLIMTWARGARGTRQAASLGGEGLFTWRIMLQARSVLVVDRDLKFD